MQIPPCSRYDRSRSSLFAAVLVVLPVLAGCSVTDEGKPPQQQSPVCLPPAPPNLQQIQGGTFVMGEDPHYPEEGPPQRVSVDDFRIGTTEVTNAQFARFVAATGYVTMAERKPPVLPGAPPEMLKPGSAVFRVPTPDNPSWWAWVPGAQWRHPTGPGSMIEGRDNDPVVQVAYDDAQAYARWVGLSLPTEQQWEYAARAGNASLPEPNDHAGKPQANYYQGVFPIKDTGADGYTSRAPVGCFMPNAFGLYDMIGNVWEWTTTAGSRPDASEPVGVIKGGSFLCAANYCARYRPAARQFQERGLGTDHIGFRVVDASTLLH